MPPARGSETAQCHLPSARILGARLAGCTVLSGAQLVNSKLQSGVQLCAMCVGACARTRWCVRGFALPTQPTRACVRLARDTQPVRTAVPGTGVSVGEWPVVGVGGQLHSG